MLARLWRWVRGALETTGRDDDLRDELRAHIEHRTDDLIRSGVEPVEARRRAHVEFGGVEGHAEAVRDDERAWLRGLPESLGREMRLGARRLAASTSLSTKAAQSASTPRSICRCLPSPVACSCCPSACSALDQPCV